MNSRKKYGWLAGIVVWIGLALAAVEYAACAAGLELRTFAQTIKGSYLWFVMPCAVLYAVNRLMLGPQDVEERRGRRWVRRGVTAIGALAILLASFCRGAVYTLSSELVTEEKLEDGYIRGTMADFLSETTYVYYEPVAVIFREPFSGWTEEELLRKVREQYGESAELVEMQADGRAVFRVPDKLAPNESIYFHVPNEYQIKSNHDFQVLLSEACHFWNNRDRYVSLSDSGNAKLEDGRDTGAEGWKQYWEEPNKLYITCYDTEADTAACAADLTDWLAFVKGTGQLSYEDTSPYNLVLNIMIGNSGDYFSLDLAPLSDAMGDESWTVRYERIKEKIADSFDAHEKTAEYYEKLQEEREETPLSDEEYNSWFMENYRGEYEKECLVGDGRIQYRAVVVDAALGSRYYALLKSSDSGKTWEVWSRAPFGEDWGMGIDFTFLDENFGFATLMHNGGDSADLYVTEDGGKSYQRAVMQEYTVTLEDGYTYAPYDYPRMPYEENGALYVLCGQGADGDYDGGDAAGLALYQSSDRGRTWTFVEIQRQSGTE